MVEECICLDKGVLEDIVSLRRLTTIDSVCHGWESYDEDFFYVYMVFFCTVTHLNTV